MSRCAACLVLVALAGCSTKATPRSDTASPAAATIAGTPTVDAAAARRAIDSANARETQAALRGDTATFANQYAEDAILMPPGAKAVTGHDAIAKVLAGLMVDAKVTSFSLTTQDVITAGDYAIETGVDSMTLQPKTGKAITDVGKYLTVWKRQPDGGYKMVRDIFNSDGPMK